MFTSGQKTSPINIQKIYKKKRKGTEIFKKNKTRFTTKLMECCVSVKRNQFMEPSEQRIPKNSNQTLHLKEPLKPVCQGRIVKDVAVHVVLKGVFVVV